MLDPAHTDAISGGPDPQTVGEIAYMTADVVVRRGRASADPDVLERLITLVDREGIEAVAGMWADSPANTLPGALWRMYVLRDWIRANPDVFALHYRLGEANAEYFHVVAGVSSPPLPDDVVHLADTVLSGLFNGDLAIALERAASFCRVVAVGATHAANSADTHGLHASEGKNPARRMVQTARSLIAIAEDLEEAAALWRIQRLD